MPSSKAKKRKAQHGGARLGAGRKPKVAGDPVKPVTIGLRLSTLARLDTLDGSRSENVDALVNEALDARARRRLRVRSTR